MRSSPTKHGKRVLLQVRVSPEIADAIDRLAAADNRCRANYLVNVLTQHVETIADKGGR